MTSFFVAGLPQPQGSSRAFVIGGKAHITSANPKLKSWRNDFQCEALKHCSEPMTGPVEVKVTFRFPRPKSHLRANGQLRSDAPVYHTVRPDGDKLARAALDGGTGILWRDDSQVCDLNAIKVYVEEFEAVGTSVVVGTLQ